VSICYNFVIVGVGWGKSPDVETGVANNPIFNNPIKITIAIIITIITRFHSLSPRQS
jgi:hypothetical protein